MEDCEETRDSSALEFQNNYHLEEKKLFCDIGHKVSSVSQVVPGCK